MGSARTTVLTPCSLGVAQGEDAARAVWGARGLAGGWRAEQDCSGSGVPSCYALGQQQRPLAARERGRSPGQHPPRPALPLASSTSEHRNEVLFKFS